MDIFNSKDSIIACSTCTEKNAAIAIIRISGFENLLNFQTVFSFDLTKVRPKVLNYGSLIDLKKNIIDKIVFSYFETPKSYTGENLLELFVHGNKINIKKIINLFTTVFHCRVADPGEFTFRALQNKKMALSEVEGLEMVLNATNPFMLNQGQKALLGELNSEYQKLYDLFLKMKTGIELMVDFSEDVNSEQSQKIFEESFAKFSSLIKSLSLRCSSPLNSILSPSIIILGQANAGKSTFFNYLLGEERSIVSTKEGTTRDFISEFLSVEENYFKLIDCAGIRQNVEGDDIEAEGILRAVDLAQKSFVKVLLINPFLPLDPFFLEKLESLAPIDLLVFTHSDLDLFNEKKEGFAFLKDLLKIEKVVDFTKNFQFAPIEPVNKQGCGGSIGAEKNDLFRTVFYNFINKKYSKIVEGNPILIERHRQIIQNISNKINNLDIYNQPDVAILAQEVSDLGRELSQLVGIITPDGLLTSIFNNFCIGK